jgi:hypothetical protein
MIAVPLPRSLAFICVASPAYLDRFGEPGTPEELQRHHCIGHRMPSGKLYRWEFERAGQELAIDANGPVVLDDEELMVVAATEAWASLMWRIGPLKRPCPTAGYARSWRVGRPLRKGSRSTIPDTAPCRWHCEPFSMS